MTLVEVMLAVTIVSMGLTVLVAAAAGSLRVAVKAKQYEQARQLFSRLELEEPMQLDEVEEGTETGTFSDPYEAYNWERDIRMIGKEEDEIFEITTSVLWEGRNKVLRESVTTLLHVPTARRAGWIEEEAL